MFVNRLSRIAILVVATIALSLAGAFVPQAAAKPKNVDVLGFSLRSSQRTLVEAGSTLESRNCKPRRLFAFVALSKVRRGAELTWTWRHDGRVVTRYEEPWAHGGKRRVVRLILSNSLGLPKGTYQVAVKIPGKGTALGKIALACRR